MPSFVLACLLVLLVTQQTTSVFIDNTRLRHTTDGDVVVAQDGNVVFHPPTGLYYFFAMDYGNCTEQTPRACSNTTVGACGVRDDHLIVVYSSPDLAMDSWTLVTANALPVNARPTGVYYRPNGHFNPLTKLWVMWVRWVEPPAMKAPTHYMTLTAPTPAGPYTIHNQSVAVANGQGADEGVFIDEDGVTAYLVYSSRPNHQTAVDRLAPDWLSSLGPSDPAAQSSGYFGDKGVEGTAMFKRNGTYYVTFGHLCCFCAGGSNLWVYASSNPLGPYTLLGDIGDAAGAHKASVTKSQQSDVFRVGDNWVYFGNQWQSALSGPAPHEKDHDLLFWQVLQWPDGSQVPAHMTWMDNFTLPGMA